MPLSWCLPAVPLKINNCSVSTVKSLEFYSFWSLTLFVTFPSYQADILKTHFCVSTLCYTLLVMDFYSLLWCLCFFLGKLSAESPNMWVLLQTTLPSCRYALLFFFIKQRKTKPATCTKRFKYLFHHLVILDFLSTKFPGKRQISQSNT